MDLATGRGLTTALRSRGYQLRGPAGVGASGPAWSASSPTGERVVVSVLDLELTLVERRAALERLETLRGVAHEHLVRLEDLVAVDAHRTALVSAAVEGPTVGAVAAVRPAWAPGELVTLLVPLAGALGALHSRGLAHGDLAPENVVLGPGGVPVLVDLASIVLPTGGTRGFAAARGRAGSEADVESLARLGLSLLGAEGGPLRPVLEQAVRERPGAAELAARVFAAVPPEPIEVPEAAVLTRVALSQLADPRAVDRTLPDPRARRRRRVRLVLGTVAAVALALGTAGLLPERGGGAHGRDAVSQAAVELTLRRAEVLGARDASRLTEVLVEGSPAFVADEALLASLASAEDSSAVSARVLETRRLGSSEGRELVAVTSAYRWGTTEGEPREVVLALERTTSGWRVVEVLAPGEEPGLVDAARGG